jgi:hypothetical protein
MAGRGEVQVPDAQLPDDGEPRVSLVSIETGSRDGKIHSGARGVFGGFLDTRTDPTK